MQQPFRAFKRHYYKVRKLLSQLVDDEPFVFHLDIDQEGQGRAQLTTPDEELTVRLAVLMRPFLNEASHIHYAKIWGILQTEFADQLSPAVIEKYKHLHRRVAEGDIKIAINNEVLAAIEIYSLLSEGMYFDKNEESRKHLQDLLQMPIAEPLLWSQFYSYTTQSYRIVSMLYHLIQNIERSEHYRAAYPDDAPVEQTCIYCLGKSGGFTSEEHIFPESLGNDELVLPRGYVCDECNHQVLSTLDTTLLEFEPISLLQVLYVPYTKSGKLPSARFQNVRFTKAGPNRITIAPQDKSGEMQNRQDLGDGWLRWEMNMRGKVFDPLLFARSLYKIGLGLVALGQGIERACDPTYNRARQFILGKATFPNYLLMNTQVQPTAKVEAKYIETFPGTVVSLSIYGLRCMYNLEGVPVITTGEEMRGIGFAAYSLAGDSCPTAYDIGNLLP